MDIHKRGLCYDLCCFGLEIRFPRRTPAKEENNHEARDGGECRGINGNADIHEMINPVQSVEKDPDTVDSAQKNRTVPDSNNTGNTYVRNLYNSFYSIFNAGAKLESSAKERSTGIQLSSSPFVI